MQTNRAISLAWAAAFVVLVASDVIMAYVPQVPVRAGILVSIAALALAAKYTTKRARNAAEASSHGDHGASTP